jgi:hypothetical protein
MYSAANDDDGLVIFFTTWLLRENIVEIQHCVWSANDNLTWLLLLTVGFKVGLKVNIQSGFRE